MIIPKPAKAFESYKYRVRRGNNAAVVRSMMKKRWWWEEADKKESLEGLNLYWDPGRNKKFIEKLQPHPSQLPQQPLY